MYESLFPLLAMALVLSIYSFSFFSSSSSCDLLSHGLAGGLSVADGGTGGLYYSYVLLFIVWPVVGFIGGTLIVYFIIDPFLYR
jgi:hypothetical protein